MRCQMLRLSQVHGIHHRSNAEENSQYKRSETQNEHSHIMFAPLNSPQILLLGCTVSPVNSQPARYQGRKDVTRMRPRTSYAKGSKFFCPVPGPFGAQRLLILSG